jgi:hypothetical protein
MKLNGVQEVQREPDPIWQIVGGRIHRRENVVGVVRAQEDEAITAK